jgi:hypothetical protein
MWLLEWNIDNTLSHLFTDPCSPPPLGTPILDGYRLQCATDHLCVLVNDQDDKILLRRQRGRGKGLGMGGPKLIYESARWSAAEQQRHNKKPRGSCE